MLLKPDEDLEDAGEDLPRGTRAGLKGGIHGQDHDRQSA